MGKLGDFFGSILDPIGTAYRIYQDQRNFNYEKGLQQEVFNREDTAYQRAVADAQAAGLSKGVVSGGAGAGSVLGASSTDIGGTNFFSNYQQRKMNALSMKQMDVDYSMSRYQKLLLQNQYDESLLNLYSNPFYKDYTVGGSPRSSAYADAQFDALMAEQKANKAKFDYYASHPWLSDAMQVGGQLLNAGTTLLKPKFMK